MNFAISICKYCKDYTYVRIISYLSEIYNLLTSNSYSKNKIEKYF